MLASLLIGMAILGAGIALVNDSPVPCNGSPSELARARRADRSMRSTVCMFVIVVGFGALIVRACASL
jgi:hypothetical protein